MTQKLAFIGKQKIVNGQKGGSLIETKVSIILTSYNKPRLLEQAIESVLNQTMREWELWIMDDHSNIETVQTIQRYLEDPRIMYRNSGIEDEKRYQTTRYATMINEAIPLIKGNYLTYLTDDTVYMPNRLEEMVTFLERNSGIDIVYSSQQVKIVNDQMTCLKEFTREAEEILFHAADEVDHCSVMHTRKILIQVWEKFGSYWDEDPKHWCRGDAVFWQRLNTFQSFYPIPKVLDITYKTPQSVQTLFRNLPATLPDGILVKGTEGCVYLMDNGQRRLLDPTMFTFYHYNPGKIVDIPDPVLYRHEEGIPIDDQLQLPPFRLYQDDKGNLFYMEHGWKRRITSPILLRKYRFLQREIIPLKEKILNEFPLGPEIDPYFIKPLLENKVYKNHTNYWFVTNHSLHPIDKKVLERLKMNQDPIPIPKNIIQAYKKSTLIVGGY